MCLEEKEPFPEIAAIRKERERFDAMSCSELREYLGQNWDVLQEGRKQYLPSLMVGKGCQEAVPFLLRQLKSDDPFSRMQALHGLTELNCREHRQHFIDCHLNDPDETVRTTALIELCVLFRNERDLEILQLALSAWDDPDSSVAMRVTAGAAMMYQLDVPHDERGAPAWWNEEEKDLQHPQILKAVAETRQRLSQDEPEGSA